MSKQTTIPMHPIVNLFNADTGETFYLDEVTTVHFQCRCWTDPETGKVIEGQYRVIVDPPQLPPARPVADPQATGEGR